MINRKRKLIKGVEHRFHGRIIRFRSTKQYNRWKRNKIYSTKIKEFVFKYEHLGTVEIVRRENIKASKMQEEAEEEAEEEEIIISEPPISKSNVKIVATLYKYETDDGNGRTLELDIVCHIIVSHSEYELIDNKEKLMASFIQQNLISKYYGGLAAATEYSEDKYGIEISATDHDVEDFIFDRFLINRVDKLDSINAGVANAKTRNNNDKQAKI